MQLREPVQRQTQPRYARGPDHRRFWSIRILGV
jgi:hypothetical protein